MTTDYADYAETLDAEFYIDGTEPDETESPEVTTEVSTDFAEAKQETARAKQYRKKVSRALGTVWRPLLADSRTVDDAAAILQYGPDFARTTGALADQDAKARKIIDFVTDGVDNPYINVFAAGFPMILQLMRNHEDQLSVAKRKIRIPFTKIGFELKLGLKLGRLRNFTNEPSALTKHVLSNPALTAVLKKQGITVAWSNDTANANGTGKPSRFRTRS
jgi:hypothetical protein